MAALIWNFDQVVRQVTLARDKLLAELRARNSEGAERVGISILRNVQEAYDVKARGGVGEDGILWRDLAPATIRARLNRATKKFRNYTKATKRKKLAALSLGSGYEIGVDTGLQRSSGSPGFSDPTWNQTPSDAFGHNTFVVDAGRVTIGYDRTYSAAFDAERKLLPENLPDPWRVEAESAFSTWADQIIQSGLN